VTSATASSDQTHGVEPFPVWPAGEDEGLTGLDEGRAAWVGADLAEAVSDQQDLVAAGCTASYSDIGELASQRGLRQLLDRLIS